MCQGTKDKKNCGAIGEIKCAKGTTEQNPRKTRQKKTRKGAKGTTEQNPRKTGQKKTSKGAKGTTEQNPRKTGQMRLF